MHDLHAVRVFLDDRHRRLADRLVGFVEAAATRQPPAESDDDARHQARTFVRALGRDGWCEPILEQDLRSCCLVREALAGASPLADAVFALQALGTMPIILRGTSAQRDQWLSAVAAGDAMAAFAMTEPEAGSDVAALQTVADRERDGYRLNGYKTFISNAGIADFYTVFATTDSTRGPRGITCFLVPADTPGLEFVKPQTLSAPHPLGEIRLRDCRVRADALVGDEGEGFRLAMATFDRLRPTVAAAACGMAGRALDEALAHVRTRTQFGKPLAEFQLTQQKLARMATDLTAARLLTYRAAWEKDSGADRITVEAAMAKAFATEAAQRIVDDAVQLFGGAGVLAAHPVDRLYRAVRALRIYEGTTEIQQLVIANRLLTDESS